MNFAYYLVSHGIFNREIAENGRKESYEKSNERMWLQQLLLLLQSLIKTISLSIFSKKHPVAGSL